ncbi:hypothetical protein Taro_002342 [Colocasia esculenta]|uniref:Uncharacterized protein n=1 Tax=Colocasia esculenta TaxID=4460 RepID=A0A843TKH8_COLES|nr:hypothetical protein [Colocasia esculenta]
MSEPQLSFPCHNRTPKHHGFLNTLHQTLGDDFTSCWGRVDEFLEAGEQEITHTKRFFFLIASAATCTDSHLEVDQSTLCQYKAVLDRNPRTCLFSVGFWRRPCEHDDLIGHILGSCHDSKPIAL